MRRVVLHLDMDAFFAAVEQLDNPECRGKPVVVGADPKGGKGRGVVSTCSYEAREYGIHSAMPISEAYKRCPTAVFLPVRGRRYAEVSRHIMSILRDFSPEIEQISIDEAFVELTGTEKVWGEPRVAAERIKQRILEETGLTASVGGAPNKFLAKVASDLRKPDGLVVVEEDEVEEFLFPLPISKLWGVGEKTLPLLERMGFQTIGDIARCSQRDLTEKLGRLGHHLWSLANGIDDRSVVSRTSVKSVSKEITFETDIDDINEMKRTLLHLAEGVARTLRKDKTLGRTVVLKVRLEDFSTFTRSRTLPDPVNSSEAIRSAAMEMFEKFNRRGKKVRLLGVGVSGLVPASKAQLSLFGENKAEDSKVDLAMDQVRDKFGERAITRASLLGKRHDRQGQS